METVTATPTATPTAAPTAAPTATPTVKPIAATTTHLPLTVREVKMYTRTLLEVLSADQFLKDGMQRAFVRTISAPTLEAIHDVLQKVAQDAAKKSNKGRSSTRDPNAPKAYRNAFIQWMSDPAQKSSAANLGKDRFKVMSKKWRTLSEDDKAPFVLKAETDRKRYKREKEEYDREVALKKKSSAPTAHKKETDKGASTVVKMEKGASTVVKMEKGASTVVKMEKGAPTAEKTEMRLKSSEMARETASTGASASASERGHFDSSEKRKKRKRKREQQERERERKERGRKERKRKEKRPRNDGTYAKHPRAE